MTYIAYSRPADRIGATRLVSALLTLSKGNCHLKAHGTKLATKRYVSGQAGPTELDGPRASLAAAPGRRSDGDHRRFNRGARGGAPWS